MVGGLIRRISERSRGYEQSVGLETQRMKRRKILFWSGRKEACIRKYERSIR